LPGSFTAATEFTAARLIDDERHIDLNSKDYAQLILDTENMLVEVTLLKANASLNSLKTVGNPIASDVTTLKSDYAALLATVDKPSTAPTSDNASFWNSLRRENRHRNHVASIFALYSDRVHCRWQLCHDYPHVGRRLLHTSAHILNDIG